MPHEAQNACTRMHGRCPGKIDVQNDKYKPEGIGTVWNQHIRKDGMGPAAGGAQHSRNGDKPIGTFAVFDGNEPAEIGVVEFTAPYCTAVGAGFAGW